MYLGLIHYENYYLFEVNKFDYSSTPTLASTSSHFCSPAANIADSSSKKEERLNLRRVKIMILSNITADDQLIAGCIWKLHHSVFIIHLKSADMDLQRIVYGTAWEFVGLIVI